MTTYGLPLFLEDTTGLITRTEFCDIYDRPPRLRVVQAAAESASSSSTHAASTQIFELSQHASAGRALLPHPTAAAAALEFGADNSLGTIALPRLGRALRMDEYLRPAAVESSGRSYARKFRASNGIEYVWGFRTLPDQEWTCLNAHTLELVAHYDLKTPGEPAYDTSGNVLTVYEEFQGLTIELLATLIIMRHIRMHRL